MTRRSRRASDVGTVPMRPITSAELAEEYRAEWAARREPAVDGVDLLFAELAGSMGNR